MTQENLLSTLRAILILAGSYVVGHNLFGLAINVSSWQVIMGALVTVASAIWGIATKTATIEGVESAARSVITSIGGLLAASGVISGDTLNSILGLVAAVLPAIQSALSKSKNQQIAAGTMSVSPSTGKATVITPAVGSSALPGK